MKQSEVEEIGTCLLLLLDNTDYINYPSYMTEIIGANIPRVILERCLKAKKRILKDRERLNPR